MKYGGAEPRRARKTATVKQRRGLFVSALAAFIVFAVFVTSNVVSQKLGSGGGPPLAAGGCDLSGWAGVKTHWAHGGAAELCFCAYAGWGGGWPANDWEAVCPTWPGWVSVDGKTPDKLSVHGLALVIGKREGSGTTRHYGSVLDWAVDLGSGYFQDCDASISPDCESVGAHVLSIPRTRYFSRCCDASDETSLASLLPDPPSVDDTHVCDLLRDMVEGGIAAVKPLADGVRSCDKTGEQLGGNQTGVASTFRVVAAASMRPKCDYHTGEEPTEANGCLAQCMHIDPDVFYLHMHTSVRVKDLKEAPVCVVTNQSGRSGEYQGQLAQRFLSH